MPSETVGKFAHYTLGWIGNCSTKPTFQQKAMLTYKIHQVLIELLFDDDTAVHVATHTKYKLKTAFKKVHQHISQNQR